MNTVSIQLFDAGWTKIGGHYWRGYAWLDDKPWTPADYDGTPLERILPRLNGCFCWAMDDERFGHVQAVMDQAGSFPLYFGEGYLTDRPQNLGLKVEHSWLDEAHWQFVEALPGRATIYSSCQALLPGEFIEEQFDGNWEIRSYSSTFYGKAGDGTDFTKAVMNSAERLIRYADGRPIAVLLSDGYDSRLILASLIRLNCPGLSAVTYGIQGNGVVERAREICRRLSVPFHFIDYDDAVHAEVMARDYPELVEKYANGQVVIQEQEVFAVERIKAIMPEDIILVPGISGDLAGGSYVPPFWFRWPGNRSDAGLRNWLSSRLTRYNSSSWPARRWKHLIDLKHIDSGSERAAVAATEKVVVQERVSKYVCSTLRVYEYHGLDWYLPQWDADFITFWDAQPIENRRFRRKYRTWCKELFFIPAGIHFEGEGEVPKISLVRLIRRFLPFGNRLAGGIPDPNRIAPILEKLLGQKIEEKEVNAELGLYLVDYYHRKSEQEVDK